MTNKTWTTGDALTGATLNKEISGAVSAGGAFTPYTPLVGAYARNAAYGGGATGAPISLGASQSTGGYALQGDLVHFWAMYRWDATQSFNGATSTGDPRGLVMAAPFPLRALDWSDYGTASGTDLAKARWLPTSIGITTRIDPKYGFQKGSTVSPFYDAWVAGFIDNLSADWSDAQVASLVCFRADVGSASYTQINNRDIQFDTRSDPNGGNNPGSAAYNFTNEDVSAWFFMSGWYIRTDDRLIEHPNV